MHGILSSLIGENRLATYAGAPPKLTGAETAEIYLFDLALRSALLRSFALVEHLILFKIVPSWNLDKPITFGDIRRKLEHLPLKDKHRIARELGFRQYLELRATLANLNAFRNRVAHHNRTWNFKVKQAVPKLLLDRGPVFARLVSNPFSVGGCIAGILFLVGSFKPVSDLETELNHLIRTSTLENRFLLLNMGFEVP